MPENQNYNTKHSSPPPFPPFSTATIKGLFMLAIGIVFILYSYGIILHMIFFCVGLMLAYQGLTLLGVQDFRPYLHAALAKIKYFFSK